MDGTDSRNENLDTTRKRLNVVTQETRFSLVQDILGHPSGLPTLKELDYANPSRSQTTIRQHLQRLVEAGIVEKVELPEDRRQNDLPYTFYGLSEAGRRFLEEHKLLRAEETLGEIYDRVEKTARSSAMRQLRGLTGESLWKCDGGATVSYPTESTHATFVG